MQFRIDKKIHTKVAIDVSEGGRVLEVDLSGGANEFPGGMVCLGRTG